MLTTCSKLTLKNRLAVRGRREEYEDYVTIRRLLESTMSDGELKEERDVHRFWTLILATDAVVLSLTLGAVLGCI